MCTTKKDDFRQSRNFPSNHKEEELPKKQEKKNDPMNPPKRVNNMNIR